MPLSDSIIPVEPIGNRIHRFRKGQLELLNFAAVRLGELSFQRAEFHFYALADGLRVFLLKDSAEKPSC